MRIVGGKWRSRGLIRPKTALTRPVPDRVREAVFDILGARFETPGGLPALHVADVFAGGGSMGLEALSRGAASCSFYERNGETLDVLRQNLEALGAGLETRVVPGDAWLRAASGLDEFPIDLVLLDPPYADSADTSQRGSVRRFLGRLVGPNERYPLVVLHHQSSACFADDPAGVWRIVDVRAYGTSAVTLFER